MTLTKKERFWRDLEAVRRSEGCFCRVPELTVGMREILDAIELSGGCLAGVRFVGASGVEWKARTRRRVWLFRQLLRARLIEVVSLSPSVYRITRLGRLARGLGG